MIPNNNGMFIFYNTFDEKKKKKRLVWTSAEH